MYVYKNAINYDNTILHFSREMDRFIGYVCLVMNISKHYCKSALVQVTCVKLLSFYWNFLIPVFCIDWLSCELSEQNCFNCDYFFLVVMNNFLFSFCIYNFIIVFFLHGNIFTSSAQVFSCSTSNFWERKQLLICITSYNVQ